MMDPKSLAEGLARLRYAYPHTTFDEGNTAAYAEALSDFKGEDLIEGVKAIVKVSKFFPSIAEVCDAIETACRKRLEAKDHEEREERLALQAGEDKIMDPKSSVHGVIVGPNHQRFVDMLEGRIVLPEPEWKKKPAPESAEKYKPISVTERVARVDILRQQASMLLKGEA